MYRSLPWDRCHNRTKDGTRRVQPVLLWQELPHRVWTNIAKYYCLHPKLSNVADQGNDREIAEMPQDQVAAAYKRYVDLTEGQPDDEEELTRRLYDDAFR